MGCFSRRCECISWAKKELSSSEERPNIALKGICRTHGISDWLLHTRLVFNRKQDFVGFLVSVKHEPGVWSGVANFVGEACRP